MPEGSHHDDMADGPLIITMRLSANVIGDSGRLVAKPEALLTGKVPFRRWHTYVEAARNCATLRHSIDKTLP